MGSGAYLDGGRTPPHVGAWEKKRLGWLRPERLAGGFAGSLSLSPAAAEAAAFEILTERSTFLLENRQRIGFDYIPARARHARVARGRDPGVVDLGRPLDCGPRRSRRHPRLGLASGGTPFPGADRRDALTCATTPSSADYDGSCSFELTGIVEEGARRPHGRDRLVEERRRDHRQRRGRLPHPLHGPRHGARRVDGAGAGRHVPRARAPSGRGVARGRGAGAVDPGGTRRPPLVMPGEDSAVSGFTLRPPRAPTRRRLCVAARPRHGVHADELGVRGLLHRDGPLAGMAARVEPPTRAARVTNNVFDGNTYGCRSPTTGSCRRSATTPSPGTTTPSSRAPPPRGPRLQRVLAQRRRHRRGRRLRPRCAREGFVLADPAFVNPDAGDYRLSPGSPCIDAGDPGALVSRRRRHARRHRRLRGPECGAAEARRDAPRERDRPRRLRLRGDRLRGTCSATYASATNVTLAAEPAPGSRFDGWSGACQGPGDCALTVSGDVAVTARFTSTSCPVPDDCHEPFVDASGACVPVPKPDGAACDDGDACTRRDACLGGACVGSDLVRCESPEPSRSVGVQPRDRRMPPAAGARRQRLRGQGPVHHGRDLQRRRLRRRLAGPVRARGRVPHARGVRDHRGRLHLVSLPDGTPCSIGLCIAGVCTAESRGASRDRRRRRRSPPLRGRARAAAARPGGGTQAGSRRSSSRSAPSPAPGSADIGAGSDRRGGRSLLVTGDRREERLAPTLEEARGGRRTPGTIAARRRAEAGPERDERPRRVEPERRPAPGSRTPGAAGDDAIPASAETGESGRRAARRTRRRAGSRARRSSPPPGATARRRRGARGRRERPARQRPPTAMPRRRGREEPEREPVRGEVLREQDLRRRHRREEPEPPAPRSHPNAFSQKTCAAMCA